MRRCGADQQIGCAASRSGGGGDSVVSRGARRQDAQRRIGPGLRHYAAASARLDEQPPSQSQRPTAGRATDPDIVRRNTLTHLRDVLGDQTYESLAHTGETMTTAVIATYAYDQIDQARTGLTDPPEFQ